VTIAQPIDLPRPHGRRAGDPRLNVVESEHQAFIPEPCESSYAHGPELDLVQYHQISEIFREDKQQSRAFAYVYNEVRLWAKNLSVV
jgi:hypothetical protein